MKAIVFHGNELHKTKKSIFVSVQCIKTGSVECELINYTLVADKN